MMGLMLIPNDTSSRADEVHLELLRKAPEWRRLEMVGSLVRITRQLSWDGFCRQFSELTENERSLKWVELHYGPLVASRLASRLS